ncbi:MAG: hypothetical protein IJD04_02490 [Desulfovibrionaceae bacterium]|nr:hypothetical protein [Desulfovibrionaceae bacterium]
MATELSSVLQMAAANPRMETAGAQRAQARPAGASFASVMSQVGGNAQAIEALINQNTTPGLGMGAPSSTERHFEQVLGDSIGLVNARALAQFSDFMSSRSESNLDVARNVLGTRNILATVSGQIVQDTGGSHIVRRQITPPASSSMLSSIKPMPTQPAPRKADVAPSRSGLTVSGALSARFESGEAGIAAIGYDRHGGTSYGKYQISSKAGSMDQFIKFLSKEAPELAKRLQAAGPANTGSKSGKMPAEWKKIAQEHPDFFKELQERFIHDSHYKPALVALSRRTELDNSNMSVALQEVLWSTAVQHGPNGAARIFTRAINQIDPSLAETPGSKEFEQALIEKVYNVRSTQFDSSTARVQNAVQNRLREEKSLALNMLNHLA